MATGRTSEPRSVTVTKTNGQATVTAPAGSFNEEDAGRPISGTGIPASTTLLTITSDTAATLSANATATGAAAATIGTSAVNGSQTYGFMGWSPETDAESETYSVTAVNAAAVTPDRLSNNYTGVSQRSRG